MAYITDSWAEIDRNCKLGKAQELYSLGDLKTITFTIGYVEETIDMEIVGFNHDDIPYQGKASITFISKQLLTEYRQMYSSRNNTGGWAGSYCRLRRWCNEDLFNALPSDLRSVIRSVYKLSDGGNGSTTLVQTVDTIWLPSWSEVVHTPNNLVTLDGQGTRYEQTQYPVGLASSADWRVKKKSDGTAYHWWLRSA